MPGLAPRPGLAAWGRDGVGARSSQVGLGRPVRHVLALLGLREAACGVRVLVCQPQHVCLRRRPWAVGGAAREPWGGC